MSNYSVLKALLDTKFYENSDNDITGTKANEAVKAMVDSLGAGYQFMDVATPATNPGTPDYKCFYIASTPGTYTNFGGLVVADGEVAVLKYDTAWSKEATNISAPYAEQDADGEMLLSLADLRIVKKDTFGSQISMARANQNFALTAGGGRMNVSQNDLYFGSISGKNKIRLVGRLRTNSGGVALWGLYNSYPNYADPSSPDPTGLVADSGEVEKNKWIYFDEIIDTQGALFFLFTMSPQTDNIVKVFDVPDTESLQPVESALQEYGFTESGYILQNGNIAVAVGYYTTDYIPINLYTKSLRIIGAITSKRAGQYPLAFYDENRAVIGQAYAPAEDDGTIYQKYCEIIVDDTLLASYPGAAYIRATTQIRPDLFFAPSPAVVLGANDELYGIRERRQKWDDGSYLLNMCRRVICAGDSVTRGLLIEGGAYVDGESSQNIPVIHSPGELNLGWSYPAQLQKLTPWEVINAAMSGLEAYEWLIGEREGTPLNGYPYYDFSDIDLALIEFGWNRSRFGSLTSADMDVVGTNSWAYCQIIEGIHAQNANTKIYVVISSGIDSTGFWNDGFYQELKVRYAYIEIINLNDTQDLWLGSSEYHGIVGGVYDITHFTKAGYNAKAFVIKNKIIESL